VASALLSGLEAENIAVGLAAGRTGLAEVALGSAYGGAIFMLTVALGLGVLVAPLKVQLPGPLPWLMPVIRQAVPARMGFADISAGNLIGTVLYFTLFNLGLITLLTPVAIPGTVRALDWPVLVGTSLLVAVLLRRGQLTRAHGLALLAVEAVYVAACVAGLTSPTFGFRPTPDAHQRFVPGRRSMPVPG
jgi:Ca2+/Na+ antiporter